MARRKRSAPVAIVTLASFLASHAVPAIAFAVDAPADPPAAPSSAANAGIVPAAQSQVEELNSPEEGASLLDANGHPRGAGTPAQKSPSLASSALQLDAVGAPGVARVAAGARSSAATSPAPQAAPEQTRELVTGGDKSGVSSKAISTPKGAGKIDGMGESFSAQLSTGIASFSIPLALPAARGATQPSLALAYSSASGLGLAGLGWDIGVGSIARQTDRGTPKYDDRANWHPEQDRFVFNGGQELVPLCTVGAAPALSCAAVLAGESMPPWSAGWQYFRPRVEGSFLRFFWAPNHQTWRVQVKSGETMELGVPLDGSNDSTGLEVNPAKPAQVFSWQLVRQYDAFGNANPAAGNPTPRNVVVYKYLQSGGRALLQDIYDTTPTGNPTDYTLANFAHHTRLRYLTRPDPTISFRSGWARSQLQRLVGVDVTSKTYSDGSASQRALVRRYALTYDPGFHTSFLTSVQLEGRCNGDERNAQHEDGNFALPAVTGCGKLPPITLSYTHATGTTTLAGYEPFNTTVQSISNATGSVAKAFGVSDTSVEFFDVNSDGLPDVVWSPPWKAFLNGAQGQAPAFKAGVDMLVSSPGVDAATALVMNEIELNNQNLAPLDFDGDGSVDLVHTPALNDVRVYSLAKGGPQPAWVGRKITAPQNVKVDFRSGTRATRAVDVNFDGLVDVVVATGEQLQTFFSLGRYIGGQGQFGSATRTGATTATFSANPVTACLPWAGQSVDLDSGVIQFAEMNGDGIIDIVKLEAGNVRYWPGRGDGYWGSRSRETLAGCQSGVDDTGYVTMASSPFYSGFRPERMRLEDINGDGLEDIVQVDEDSVSVWLNVDGNSWTQRARLAGMPSAALDLGKVRFADVNGSGTPDIFWGNGGTYQYIDLTGGLRTGLLSNVDNGLGKTTKIEYSTSTAEMLSAEQTGGACDANKPWSTPWCSKMPTVAHMVKRVTESDNLTVAGKSTSQVTEYNYRDPFFEGRQREFRGFRIARSRRIGDASAPGDYTESSFLLGECEDETVGAFDNLIDDCADPARDNPREALKGLPVLTHSYSETGVYLSTEATSYRLRQLYAGLDGRAVRVAFQSGKRTLKYDAAAGAASSMRQESQTAVELERGYDATKDPLKVPAYLADPTQIPAAEVSRTLLFQVPAYASYASVEQTRFEDFFGNEFLAISKGCTGGNACPTSGTGMAPDEKIYGYSIPSLFSGQLTNWLWRTAQSFVRGSVHSSVDRNKTDFTYTPEGAVKTISPTLVGSGVLDRFHAASLPVAPTPTDAVTDGTYVATQYDYDSFGNVITETLPLNRCRKISYDTLPNTGGSATFGYSQFPTTETLFPQGCGVGTGFSTSATYDRGIGRVNSEIDLAGQRTALTLDELGRLSAVRGPHADGSTVQDTDVPSATFEYILPSSATTRFSIIHTRTQDGAAETDTGYLDSYAYVDGFGRTRVTLSEADTAAGDGGNWVVSGFATLSAKGSPVLEYLPYFSSATATAFPLATAPTTAYSERAYDAFGRIFRTYDLDRTQTLEKKYHALSEDSYDAEDLSTGAHSGTYSSSRQDGHGRVIASTERIKNSGVMEAREVRVSYLPTGQAEVITRTLPDSTTPPNVMRWMRYDSFGRLILNVDPNTTVNFTQAINVSGTPSTTGIKAWRYVYNKVGELVGTSDARGCGENYFYDGVGRLTAEDYSPCESQHQPWVAPNLTVGTGYGTNVDVLYVYDSATARPAGSIPPGYATTSANLTGHLAAVYDRGENSFRTYDARGRMTRIDKRVAAPGAPTADPSVRYAEDWFSRSTTFDSADRPVKVGTGAQRAAAPQSPLAASNGTSDVTTTYSNRGLLASVGGSYGTLVSAVKHDADGLDTSLQYGDVAHTTSTFTYDARRRLDTAETDRAAPGIWSIPTSYTPAPAPAPAAATTFQLVLQSDKYSYDLVSNPVKVQDNRTAGEWPSGALPVTRTATYDDLYRISELDYAYSTTDDTWVSPHAADLGGAGDTRRVLPSPHVSFAKRVKSQTYQYDWLGNITQGGDDASGFYDRSLGTQSHDTVAPYRLKSAAGSNTSARNGRVDLAYAAPGYTSTLQLTRSGPCLPTTARCNQRFDYQWDEVGRLQTATRNDVVAQTDALGTAEAKLSFVYDANDNRVVKTSVDSLAHERYAVYAFDTFELRGATYDTTAKKYLRDATTEVAYLEAHGIQFGRLAYNPVSDNVPRVSGAVLHVFFEVADRMGSTSVVFDKDTSELVERETYFGFGATESDYRPARWKGFREENQFTGKEEDIEVGLRYFGKRYYSPYLNRWLSPDPLAVHMPGSADLNLYAYVGGSILKAVDAVGLDTTIIVFRGTHDSYHDAMVEYAKHTWLEGHSDRHVEVVTINKGHTVPSLQQMSTAWHNAAQSAKAGGKVVLVGHGSNGDRGVGWGIQVAARVKKSGNDTWEVNNRTLDNAVNSNGKKLPANEQRIADYFSAAKKELQAGHVKEVEFFGCNIGKNKENLNTLARGLGTDTRAYRAYSQASADGKTTSLTTQHDENAPSIAGTISKNLPSSTEAGANYSEVGRPPSAEALAGEAAGRSAAASSAATSAAAHAKKSN